MFGVGTLYLICSAYCTGSADSEGGRKSVAHSGIPGVKNYEQFNSFIGNFQKGPFLASHSDYPLDPHSPVF